MQARGQRTWLLKPATPIKFVVCRAGADGTPYRSCTHFWDGVGAGACPWNRARRLAWLRVRDNAALLQLGKPEYRSLHAPRTTRQHTYEIAEPTKTTCAATASGREYSSARA